MNEEIKKAIKNRFQFSVTNNDDEPRTVALLAAYFDTDRFVYDDTAKTVTKYKDNPVKLNEAGYPVDVVLDDSTFALSGGNTIVMSAGNPKYKISNLLDYIKTNPTKMTEMEIITTDKNAFDTQLMVTLANPFNRQAEDTVDLSTFFSRFQYQPDRITVDFAAAEIELSDILLMTVVVPKDTEMTFIWRF